MHDTLREIDRLYAQMQSSSRGAFLILRGESGAGKSTFLHTISQFRPDVSSIAVPGVEDIRQYFAKAKSSKPMTVFVLEEREAAVSFTDRELEDWLHAINGFIRTDRGEHALVVWPCNTDELLKRILYIAQKVGADSLLGSGEKFAKFEGPSSDQFRKIGETTIAVLNQGASFADLGVGEDVILDLTSESSTIGGFLGRIRDAIHKKEMYVQSLMKQEQARLWIIVVAGNEPSQEVAALTRGRYAALDIERLMTATEANIVQELKSHPERLGILATMLDAKILHLPVLTALATARAFAADPLKQRMKTLNLALKPDKKSDAVNRLLATDLGRIFAAGSQSLLTGGKKPGSRSVEAFQKLADIASTNDVALNRTLGLAFKEAGLINEFGVEKDFGSGLARRTDLLAKAGGSSIRLEVMWRRKTSRAEIANYALTKLANYGKALGYLGQPHVS